MLVAVKVFVWLEAVWVKPGCIHFFFVAVFYYNGVLIFILECLVVVCYLELVLRRGYARMGLVVSLVPWYFDLVFLSFLCSGAFVFSFSLPRVVMFSVLHDVNNISRLKKKFYSTTTKHVRINCTGINFGPSRSGTKHTRSMYCIFSIF